MTRPLFTWREAILQSDLPATTKHVLLTLACHMNDAGESCYPSIERLCNETSLSNRAVITHLQNAKELGWITVEKHGFAGQRWAAHEYFPAWPHHLRDIADSLAKAVNVVHNQKKKVMKEVHNVNEKAVNVVPKAVNVTQKAVKEVHTSTSESTSESTSLNTNTAPTKKPTDPTFLEGIDKQVAADFLAIRKAKKSPLTETAINGIKREADKAGYTLEQALTVCCERGWAGFKAEWILRDQANGKLSITKDQEKREATERAYARLFGKNEKEVIHETTGL